MDENGFIAYMNFKIFNHETGEIVSKGILEDNYQDIDPEIIAFDEEYRQRYIFGAFESLINSNFSAYLVVNPMLEGLNENIVALTGFGVGVTNVQEIEEGNEG